MIVVITMVLVESGSQNGIISLYKFPFLYRIKKGTYV